MKKLFLLLIICFFVSTICFAASGDVTGTYTVDGENPVADRYHVIGFAYGVTNDIAQAKNRFDNTTVASDGSWTLTGFNAGEDVIVGIYDFGTTNQKAAVFGITQAAE